MTTLEPLKQPIAIRPELIATAPTTLIVHPHSISFSGSDFTISYLENAPQPSSSSSSSQAAQPIKIFFVDGKTLSWSNTMSFIDASGLPIFELHRKKAGVTWFVSLPNTNDKSIATIAPQGHLLKDKFDVYIGNVVDGGKEVKLEASIIGVLLVQVLYKPSYQSSFKPAGSGESSSSQHPDAKGPVKS
ncbi:hypothetical protein PENSUB_11890 [Penicillium subrubescens]|uniref:Uncharacterized protein n=1 Tax=Penicillium subrubescens TaxID=1316194 RepID=A0A1Q5T1Q9_9EURO|nr:hypothetical protein PENSUB_11890 [Penicillium subrubescens]